MAGSVVRTGVGCVAMIAFWAGVSLAIDRWLGARVVAEAKPWLGVASGLFVTLSIWTLWGFFFGSARGDNSRNAILARAATGRLPDSDGVVVASGKARAASAPLRSPITDTPCVAYFYRLYERAFSHNSPHKRNIIPHYWGYGSCAFIVDTPTHAVRVMAVPELKDAATTHTAAEQIAQAQRWITATPFEETMHIAGVIGSAFSTVSTMWTDDDGSDRRDWKRDGTTRTADTLIIEETVVPVGATVSVAGPWSAQRRAIVPGASLEGSVGGAMGVAVSTGPVEHVLSGGSAVPPSKTYTVVFALVMAALAGGVVWGGMAILARPS